MNSLTTLVLENNPLSHQISHDVMGFATSLRKLFPNLQTLVRLYISSGIVLPTASCLDLRYVYVHKYTQCMQDGQQLPSPVKFDVPVTSGQLPSVAVCYSQLKTL